MQPDVVRFIMGLRVLIPAHDILSFGTWVARSGCSVRCLADNNNDRCETSGANRQRSEDRCRHGSMGNHACFGLRGWHLRVGEGTRFPHPPYSGGVSGFFRLRRKKPDTPLQSCGMHPRVLSALRTWCVCHRWPPLPLATDTTGWAQERGWVGHRHPQHLATLNQV